MRPTPLLAAFCLAFSAPAFAAEAQIEQTQQIDAGPLLNPFIDLVGLRTKEQKEWFRGNILTSGYSRRDQWHVGFYSYVDAGREGGEVSQYFIFRFNETGDVVDYVEMPEAAYAYRSPITRPSLGPASNQRWLVFPVQTRTSDTKAEERWCIVDISRRPYSFSYAPIAGSRRGLLAMRVFNDALYYCVVHNRSAPDDNSVNTLLTTGTPEYWLIRRDLPTGKEVTLASMGGNPEIGPLANEHLDGFQRIFLTEVGTLSVAGRRQKSEFVYDIAHESWRVADGLDVELAAQDEYERGPYGWCAIDVDGERWSLVSMAKDRIRAFNSATRKTLEIPVRIERSQGYKYADYGQIIFMAKHNSSGILVFAKDGIAICLNGCCYFWISHETLRTAIRAATTSKK